MRTPRHSITRYTVIEVPRFDDDPPDGEVRIALGDGMNPKSVLAEFDSVLDEWEAQH
jgi:hypothetical protein